MPVPLGLLGAAGAVLSPFISRLMGARAGTIARYGGLGLAGYGAYRAVTGLFGPPPRRRRRRKKRLTASELAELSHIKGILGKTAAANALPFYLGRG